MNSCFGVWITIIIIIKPIITLRDPAFFIDHFVTTFVTQRQLSIGLNQAFLSELWGFKVDREVLMWIKCMTLLITMHYTTLSMSPSSITLVTQCYTLLKHSCTTLAPHLEHSCNTLATLLQHSCNTLVTLLYHSCITLVTHNHTILHITTPATPFSVWDLAGVLRFWSHITTPFCT